MYVIHISYDLFSIPTVNKSDVDTTIKREFFLPIPSGTTSGCHIHNQVSSLDKTPSSVD